MLLLGRAEKIGVKLAAAMLSAFFLMPILYLGIRSELFSAQSVASLDFLGNEKFVTALADTLVLMAGSGTLAVFFALIAYFSLYLVKKKSLQNLLALLFTLPFAFPGYVGAITMLHIFGPRGQVELFLESHSIDFSSLRLIGMPGAILVIALFSFPLAFLPFYAQMRFKNRSLFEAAQTLRVSRLVFFQKVMLPGLLKPGITGFLLVAFYALGDFGTVSALRVITLTRYLFVEMGNALNPASTAILGLFLAVIPLCLTLADTSYRKRSREVWMVRSQGGGTWTPAWAPLSRFGVATLAMGLLILSLLLPLGVLVQWLVTGTQHWLGSVELTQNVWRVDPQDFLHAFLYSLLLSSAAAAAACLLIVPVIYALVRKREFKGLTALKFCGYVSYSLPGIIVGMALVFFSTRSFPGLYGTLLPLFAAWLMRFGPELMDVNRESLERLSPSLRESASTLGAGRTRSFFRVELPLLKTALLSGFCLVFLGCLKELPVALILIPSGTSLLASRIWAAMSESLYESAAPYAIALVLLAMYPVSLMLKRAQR